MSADEFSIENPLNNANGRWHRLVPLKNTDFEYSSGKAVLPVIVLYAAPYPECSGQALSPGLAAS